MVYKSKSDIANLGFDDTNNVHKVKITNAFPLYHISQWAVTGDSTANTEKTLAKAAVAATTHYVTSISVYVKAAATGNDVNVILKDGTTAKWSGVIGTSAARGVGLHIVFPLGGIALTSAAAANLVVDAAGASCVIACSMTGYSI